MSGEPTGAPARRYGPWRSEVGAFCELLAVTGLAFAQPTFDLLGKNAGLFVAWGATTLRALSMVVAVVLVPVACAYGIELVAALAGPVVRRVTHGVLLALGIGLIVLEAVEHATALGPVVVIVLGAAAGIVGALLIARHAALRTWVRILAVAPVLFASLLLFASPANGVVFESEPSFAAVKVAHPHRVVMIVMDEFPLTSLLDGHGAIDPQLYPNFAALSRDAAWYRNTTTVAPFTEAAVPAILSGQLPSKSASLPVVADHPQNLVTLLGGTYDLDVRETVTRLCPRAKCTATRRPTGVRPGFRGMLEDTGSIWWRFANPWADDTPSFGGLGGEDAQAFGTAERFVGGLAPPGASGRPQLDLVHVLLPHFPWHYLPTGQDYAALPGHTNGLHGQVWANDDVAALMRVRHLLQVQAADTFVGQVVARLKQLGVYDDTLLVVTADHGVVFEGGQPIRGLTETTWPTISWVPLFVKAPGGDGPRGLDDRAAETVDIVPTIADQLGVRIPWKVDGRSLLGAPRTTTTFPMFDWSRSPWKPPPGQDFRQLNRAEGFAQVLRAQAAPPRAPADLRVLGIGPYADLIGRPTTGLVGPPARGTSLLDGPLRYLLVNRASPKTPWVAVHGVTGAYPEGRHLAVVVNGVVAGLSTTYRSPGSDHTEFWGTLAPRAFHDGRNLVQVFAIDGAVDAPRLHLLAAPTAAAVTSPTTAG